MNRRGRNANCRTTRIKDGSTGRYRWHGGSEIFGVACVGGGDGLIEDVLLLEEMAQGHASRLELCDEIGYRDLFDGADPAAHEAVTDGADPVTEEMTIGTELKLIGDLAESRAVALVEDLNESGGERCVGG